MRILAGTRNIPGLRRKEPNGGVDLRGARSSLVIQFIIKGTQMYIIRGNLGAVGPWQNRLWWWFHGWAELFDGLVLILTMGFVCSGLTEKLAIRRLNAMFESGDETSLENW